MALQNVNVIEATLDCTTVTATGAYSVLTIPAYTVVLAAGVEVTEALTGASALTFDVGTGVDDDEWVAAYAMASKAVGAVASSTPGLFNAAAEDTIDVQVDTLTGTVTAGKLRVWAIIVDCDGREAEEVDRDLLA